ncbi:unnamed protein product [Chondrus crispus]|uniref:Uncharacterized protein n=1 Tax=Chondrus crispus TaxID=2769 RepID=R7QAV6_CHOCR|nr:unnamed protein product [Chondrus crispus]CDF35209.1 unnamed protein product [Chondrus crispus]|eukprot:XP_005715028.1 unnamed protein product [Chondrus crispus]
MPAHRSYPRRSIGTDASCARAIFRNGLREYSTVFVQYSILYPQMDIECFDFLRMARRYTGPLPFCSAEPLCRKNLVFLLGNSELAHDNNSYEWSRMKARWKSRQAR